MMRTVLSRGNPRSNEPRTFIILLGSWHNSDALYGVTTPQLLLITNPHCNSNQYVWYGLTARLRAYCKERRSGSQADDQPYDGSKSWKSLKQLPRTDWSRRRNCS